MVQQQLNSGLVRFDFDIDFGSNSDSSDFSPEWNEEWVR